MGRIVRSRALQWLSRVLQHFLSPYLTDARKKEAGRVLDVLQRAVYHATSIAMSKFATEVDGLRLTAILFLKSRKNEACIVLTRFQHIRSLCQTSYYSLHSYHNTRAIRCIEVDLKNLRNGCILIFIKERADVV